ncbi:GxxExxY protein [Roseimicrobium gellanilyticum]|uniref:GxxExxY protein n=2 Tax=Roseimicrobium gellanilyticum TaxID=748857 RepID=A0A366H5S0_9BACT|nr:GxxExxY protein [Roseimicrobium gellanilyticum]
MSYQLSGLNRLSKAIIGSAIEVHREMGPGLLESIYERCLHAELSRRGLRVESQVQLPLTYKGEVLNKALILDLVVEDSIILELKAVEVILPVHSAQLLSYLRLTGKPMGLLLNFCVPVMSKGIVRRLNDRVQLIRS